MTTAATKRILKEIKELNENPLPGITVNPDPSNMHQWIVTMDGPPDSPYAGGKFDVKVVFPLDFPFKAPKVTLNTKIYHPNIDGDGNLCMGVLKTEDWKPSFKMNTILLSLYDLLESPNPDDPLVTSIAEQYSTDRPAFNRKAAEYTQQYAK